MAYRLSKTKIMFGLQCVKRLWLEVHQPELAQYSERSDQIIHAGNDVHEAYRHLVPTGILVEHVDNLNEASDAPIFEGAFTHRGVLIRADLILPHSKRARLIEVKAAGSAKDYHIRDCAIQAWVIEGTGIPIKTIELAVINKSFVYPGGEDYRGLFRHEDVTHAVRLLIPHVPTWIRKCRIAIESTGPVVAVGKHCRCPYECPFLNHCSEPGSPYPVTCLPNGGNVAKRLITDGILDIRDIPEGRLSKSLHEKVRRVTKSGKAEISPSVAALLKQFPYPRYYLDFETIAFAVPKWPGTKPYQPLPFQWSCHVEYADGTIEHRWFLDTSGDTPMRAAANSLVSNLGHSGPIFMYKPFERTCITHLMTLVPDLAPNLEALKDRLVDLHPIVKDHYYHPGMKGSWRLKSVTACIAPEMSHAKLGEVADGMAAQGLIWK